MIRGIIFDCFGVLYHGSLEHLRELTPPEKQQELSDLSHSYDYGYITQTDYFEGVGLLIGRSAIEVGQICHAQHIRNNEMIEFVKSLKVHYKTALLSNVGRGFIEGLFTRDELVTLFNVDILSNEVGMRKPNREIYEYTAMKLDLNPSECIMIDDSPQNVSGAKDAGMEGIVCVSTEQTISELKTLLGGHNA